MRNFCVLLVSILSFNLAYCQSKPSGNSSSNNTPASSYNQIEPVQRGNDDGNNKTESAYNRSQSAFQPGIIITKDGDTLGGLIKYASSVPSDKVIYRPDWSGTDSIFSIHQVKSIVTQAAYFENIPFKGKGTMMLWLEVGKIDLYVHTKNYNDTIYVLAKNRDQFVYISYRDFKVMMRHVFFDTPDMLKKIGKQGYKFDDMINIVKEYNKRFQ